jgi:hypothetical protein
MITHYIPQWLLRRFGTPLYELDIHTGGTEPRKLRRAGSGDDLWAEDVEKGLMGTHDNDAARVIRYAINGQRRIVLSREQRHTLALWLALFMPRVPNALEDVKRMVADAKKDPQIAVDVLYENRDRVLGIIRQKDPEVYAQTIDALGQYAGEAWLMALAANTMRGRPSLIPDAEAVYDSHLRTTRVEDFAAILLGYHWTWLYSPHGFVIGDNPLVRWHGPSQRWNFGIRRANVEITVPLSAHLCLRMNRRKRRDRGQVMYCPRALAAEYNRRQRLASIAHVYAGDPALLRAVAAARLKRPKRPSPRPLNPDGAR